MLPTLKTHISRLVLSILIVTLRINIIPVKLICQSNKVLSPTGTSQGKCLPQRERRVKITRNVETWDFALRAHLTRGKEESASHHLRIFLFCAAARNVQNEAQNSPEIHQNLRISILGHLENTHFPFSSLHFDCHFEN